MTVTYPAKAVPTERNVTSPTPTTRTQSTPDRAAQVPEDGSGRFATAAVSSPPEDDAEATTYTVEVERDISVRPAVVASTVDRVLGDPRSWIGEGDHELARTNSSPELRILLATPETTDELCAPLDTGGRLSCRNGNLVVLNAWRWMNGAKAYRGDLANYRRYLVNHEVGHALGKRHTTCPGAGDPAPVMVQQTKGIGDCSPNPWPVAG